MRSSKDLPITLLSKVPGLRLEEIAIDAETVSFSVVSTYPSATCPTCGQKTARLHSRYPRSMVTGLPLGGRSVRLSLRAGGFAAPILDA